MIDTKLLRENPRSFEIAAKNKDVVIDTSHILEIDQKCRDLALEVQSLREQRNKVSKAASNPNPTERAKAIEEGSNLKVELEQKEHSMVSLKEELDNLLLTIPNPAKSDVKVDKDESENEVLRTVGEPTKFSFTPKDHVELGEALDIIDVKKAAEVSGARFNYLKNEGALLEAALKDFAFEVLLKEGFIPVIPPVLIKHEVMDALGYTAMGEQDNIFDLEKDGLYLVGTSEQSIVPLHMNEVLQKEDLPRRYVGYSTCFRREAGSYGKDTKGILRVHQFNKVEMVSFVEEGKDDEEHEYLLSLEEKFFQMLEIPYQVLRICTGDLGFNAARKYDIEAWIPSQQRYREVTSTSTVTDFQSRRLNMRYQDGEQRKFLSVLNGTAFSMNRPIVAILENYQQQDGSVVIPEVLRPYMGKDKIEAK
ncbi:MAG TPA: serine--tRNA ligase [Patescibacteria group bacterium]|nr:serine--tRNA ligase [Patescibacteria group bacterium]